MLFFLGGQFQRCEKISNANTFKLLIKIIFLAYRELEKVLAKEPGIFELDVKDSSQFPKTINSLMGTNMHKKIEISPLHYQQMDVATFHQMRIEQFLINVSFR